MTRFIVLLVTGLTLAGCDIYGGDYSRDAATDSSVSY